MKKRALLLLTGGLLALSSCDLSILDIAGGHTSSQLGPTDIGDISEIDESLKEQNGYRQVNSSISLEDYGYVSSMVALPSKGDVNILVLPIIIEGYELNDSTKTRYLSDIDKVFNGDTSDTGWESVRSFYEKSSYGQLRISATIADWYECGKTYSEIDRDHSSVNSAEGCSYVMRDAIREFEAGFAGDLSIFDSNRDGFYDGVWMVYSAPSNPNISSTLWAFTFWDYESTTTGEERNPNDPFGYTYCWASYDFMYEAYGSNNVDAHTYIHETGHMLGLEDYYETGNYNYSPCGFIDMMDNNVIDHNAYSKFSLGWVHPYLVQSAGEITIGAHWQTGDCIIIPTSDGYNGSSFDEYLIIELYDDGGLNYQDAHLGFPTGNGGYRLFAPKGPGIRVYHIDSRLALISGNSYRFIRYSDVLVDSVTQWTLRNTTNSFGEAYSGDDWFRLCTVITSPSSETPMAWRNTTLNDSHLFQVGDRFRTTDSAITAQFPNRSLANDGNRWAVSFEVTDIAEDGSSATLTFA